MRAIRLVGGALTALGLVACGGGGGSGSIGPPQQPSMLIAEVGKNDAFTIRLTDDHGTKIKNLVAGTYAVRFHDESDIHNFHLAGGGVDTQTDVGTTSDRSMRVTFRPGRYSFMCDPHSSQMHGSFVVSSPAPAPTS